MVPEPSIPGEEYTKSEFVMPLPPEVIAVPVTDSVVAASTDIVVNRAINVTSSPTTAALPAKGTRMFHPPSTDDRRRRCVSNASIRVNVCQWHRAPPRRPRRILRTWLRAFEDRRMRLALRRIVVRPGGAED